MTQTHTQTVILDESRSEKYFQGSRDLYRTSINEL